MKKIILLASVSLFTVPALAQSTASAPVAQVATPAAAPAAPKEAGLAEIVVTATKREQNLQNVPVAVTAITAASLQNQHITEFADLTRAAASLTVTQATASPNNSIILRGIGTFAFSIGVEPSVAVLVDDVPVVQQAQAFDNLTDVERIEVLRGPQGTLFGKNASAGAVSIVTKDPGKRAEASGELLATSDSQYGGNFSFSTPLGDTAGLRVSGYYSKFDGYIHNLFNGHLLGDEQKDGIRAKLLVHITPKLTATLTGNYSELNQNGTAGASGTLRSIDLVSVPNPKYAGVSILPSLVGITPGANNYNVSIDNDSPTSNAQSTFSGKLNYDIGFANILSVTSYQDWTYNFTADVDMSGLPVAPPAGAVVTNPVGPAQGVNQSGPYHSTEFTQELRLASKKSGALSYVAGLFYANASSTRSFQRGPTFAQANWSGYQGTRSMAAFASADYKLPSKTTLSGAVRVNNERIQDQFTNYLANATVYVSPTSQGSCGAGSAGCAGRNVDTVVTYKASVSQELAPRVMGFASVASGYKGYAYDISSGYSPLRTAAPVLPEHSTSFELGIKSRLMQNKVQLNVTGFYTNYNNFQAQSSQFINGSLQQKLNNVGQLRTQGLELELLTKPAPWLHIDGSAAYTDAKMVSFVGAACYAGQQADQTAAGLAKGPTGLGFCGSYTPPGATAVVQAQDRSGAALPNAPKLKMNLGATVDTQLGAATKGSFGLAYLYQSGVSFDLLGNPLLRQNAYGVLNGNVAIEHGSFKISVFANNLFNEHYVSSMGDSFGSYGTHTVFQYQPRDSQRYFGLKLGAKF
jgi:iron complex outermembrane recepter protein